MTIDWERSRLYLVAFGVLCCAGLALAACRFRDPVPVAQLPASAPVARVTAEEIARAMEEDHFFSDYGMTKLVVQGHVGSVQLQDNHAVLELATTIVTKVLCDVDGPPPAVHPGDMVIVQSTEPERQDAAVMLRHCRIQ